MSEEQLAAMVIDWLESQHWDVYQEVVFSSTNGIADIAAVRDGKLWIIECKKSLTFTVLEQAARWRAHFRSIAVPRSVAHGSRRLAYSVARDYLHLGIIEVDFSRDVWERCSAPIMREYHRCAKRMMRDLREEHKHYAAAGSRGGGYFTPYRRTMNEVQMYIRYHPGCTLKEIMGEVSHHYASSASARSGIRTALENWEDWCDVRRNGKELRYYEVNSRVN